MEKEKIEALDSRVTSLEFALKQLENQVNRLLNAHGENVPHPAGAPVLKHQDCE